ncbi:hypothetical protein NECAME_15996 [Necator americanus]|uniref:Uncharacterized protein n=1 Tax=Necator americanus TaxID=51031 RepID=W2TY43_NECAM|nr:hypothetical protein NECAME_15996 [Necator americanus]ETN86990.1 hypothetical protein NECAME_15996 [Necator americanus]
MDNIDEEYDRLVEYLHDCAKKAESFFFSTLLAIPGGDLIFEIRDNPYLSAELFKLLRKLCPGCTISLDADNTGI